MTIHEVPIRHISTLHTLKALKDVHDKHPQSLACSEKEYQHLYSRLVQQFIDRMPDKELAEEMLLLPIHEVGKLVRSSPDD